jgi:hypothetical protein
VNWIHLINDRYHWRGLFNTAMYLRVVQKEKSILVSEKLLAARRTRLGGANVDAVTESGAERRACVSG